MPQREVTAANISGHANVLFACGDAIKFARAARFIFNVFKHLLIPDRIKLYARYAISLREDKYGDI